MTDKKPDWIEQGKERMSKLIQPRPTDSCLATRMFDFVDWFANLAEEHFIGSGCSLDQTLEQILIQSNEQLKEKIAHLEAKNKRLSTACAGFLDMILEELNKDTHCSGGSKGTGVDKG
jgi:hypothetical protein